MAAIKFLLLFCVGTSLIYYLFSFYCAAEFFKQRENKLAGYLPPVSILKPVKGLEPEIGHNFESFCSLDYPAYQLTFGMIEKGDPAVSVVERIRDSHPDVDIHINPVKYGEAPNQKVWILQNLLGKSKYDILVINDADIRVRPDYLKAIVSPLKDPEVGLVTTPYRAMGTKSHRVFSRLTALNINADFFPAVMVASHLSRVDFALGATLAIRKRVLTEIGGFESLSNLLADDFYLGNKVYKAGYKIALVPYLVDTIIPDQGFLDFFHQHLRWARTLRSCRPWGYFWSVTTHGLSASTLFLLLSGFSRGGWILFALTLITRFASAIGLGLKYLKVKQYGYYLWLLPLRDFLASLFWLLSFLGNTVTWKDNRFILDRVGRIHRV